MQAIKYLGEGQTGKKNDLHGVTPLHWAAGNGHLSVFQLIVDNVNDKNPEDNMGRTPLDMATSRHRLLGKSSEANLKQSRRRLVSQRTRRPSSSGSSFRRRWPSRSPFHL